MKRRISESDTARAKEHIRRICHRLKQGARTAELQSAIQKIELHAQRNANSALATVDPTIELYAENLVVSAAHALYARTEHEYDVLMLICRQLVPRNVRRACNAFANNVPVNADDVQQLALYKLDRRLRRGIYWKSPPRLRSYIWFTVRSAYMDELRAVLPPGNRGLQVWPAGLSVRISYRIAVDIANWFALKRLELRYTTAEIALFRSRYGEQDTKKLSALCKAYLPDASQKYAEQQLSRLTSAIATEYSNEFLIAAPEWLLDDIAYRHAHCRSQLAFNVEIAGRVLAIAGRLKTGKQGHRGRPPGAACNNT